MTDQLPARSRIVHEALRAAGITGDIVVLPDAASTAPLAAAALGVEVGAIANSLVFWSDGEPLLVVRVDREDGVLGRPRVRGRVDHERHAAQSV